MYDCKSINPTWAYSLIGKPCRKNSHRTHKTFCRTRKQHAFLSDAEEDILCRDVTVAALVRSCSPPSFPGHALEGPNQGGEFHFVPKRDIRSGELCHTFLLRDVSKTGWRRKPHAEYKLSRQLILAEQTNSMCGKKTLRPLGVTRLVIDTPFRYRQCRNSRVDHECQGTPPDWPKSPCRVGLFCPTPDYVKSPLKTDASRTSAEDLSTWPPPGWPRSFDVRSRIPFPRAFG